MKLSECVTITRQFQRSVRVDSDIGKDDALNGYVCHSSARQALETMARQYKEAGQRAFTWTGPFGGGKSSLAVVVATCLAGTAEQRKLAAEALGEETTSSLRSALSVTNERWLVIPVVGHKADLQLALRAAIQSRVSPTLQRQLSAARTSRDLVAFLASLSASRPKSGVLVLFDELGKFLDHAAATNGDIHFLQDLAEGAARSTGRLVVLGILHQTFEQYALRLGHSYRDEWAKIQGRFTDISLIAALDEIVDLTARAITTTCKHPWSKAVADVVSESIKHRRPGAPPDLSDRLDKCWPLHPATAALLGPASKRRFGQNERSTFGFLATAEHLGFQEFLEVTDVEQKRTYEPSAYWDYLKTNLEPTILASPDGHRWALAVDAVERCEAKGGTDHVKLIKCIAVLDLFRNGSGLSADRDTLRACLPNTEIKSVDVLLRDLETWSIAVYRKHLGSWTVFSGSDFDIEAAVKTVLARGVELKLAELSEIAGLSPIVAKRLYHETGTLRWFHSEMCSFAGIERRIGMFNAADGAAGTFLLILPTDGEQRAKIEEACKEISSRKREYPIVLGVPTNADVIIDLASELVALQTVKRERPELDGDPVARRELTARTGDLSARLEDELRSALFSAKWFFGGSVRELDNTGLAGLATDLAKRTFSKSVIIRSEMVNRHRPSSNTQAAVRQLLWAMVKNPHLERLGIEGFSAERGLYATTLEVTGLHGPVEGGFSFRVPDAKNHQAALASLWKAAAMVIDRQSAITPISDIYAEWLSPPFGVRKGLLPILGLAFVLSNLSRIAIYRQGVYQSDINEVLADVLLQDPALVGVRLVSKDEQYEELVGAYADAIADVLGSKAAREPLDISRALVGFAIGLTPWARRTTNLSNLAVGIRRLLLDASDPQKLLLVDIPMLFGVQEPSLLGVKLKEALKELAGAYEHMLRDIQAKMLSALGATDVSWVEVARRAEAVVGATGDLRLDAFAVRLSTFGGDLEQLEGIVSMAINRPPRDWSDRDPDAAALELASLALRFRQAEVLVAVKGRAPTRQAIGLVIGTGEAGNASLTSFDVADTDRMKVQEVARILLHAMHNTGLPTNVLLASVAEAGGELMRRANTENEH